MPRKYAPRGIPLTEKIDFYSIRDPATGCRLWQGSTIEDGYGRMWWNGRLWLVHRAAYVDANGPISDDIKVCHSCDRPACSELDHLFLGTDADNNVDMRVKGRERHPRGVDLPFSKLTEEQIIDIRASKVAQEWLAKMYGVSQSTISTIKRRTTWKHIP